MSARSARSAKSKGRGPGKPFAKGLDPRRNLKGPVPEVFELKQALARDGHFYINQLYKLAATGDATAVKFAIEQIIGKAPQSVEVSGPGGKAIEVTDIRDRLAARMAAQFDAAGTSEADSEPK